MKPRHDRIPAGPSAGPGEPLPAGPPVGVAVLGYGPWGTNHARALTRTRGARLAGIVEPDPHRRAAARAAHPGVPVLADARDALRDPDTEAVVVATPARTHPEVAARVIGAGRHVLVEKPFAQRGRDAERLLRAAGEAGVVAMAGHTFLYSRPVLNIARMLRTGQLSAPLFVRSERLGSRRHPDCGALWNLAPHDVSILLHVLDSPVVSLTARSHVFGRGEHDDATGIDLEFASGAGAVVQVSWCATEKRRALSVRGEDWTVDYRMRSGGDDLTLAFDAGSERPVPERLRRALRRGLDVDTDGRVRYEEPLQGELEHFALCCRTGRTPRSGAWHAAETSRVLEAAARSAAAGGARVGLTPGTGLAA
ncbi:Gfo/Idh/MocA family oxidoreductase [Streptomyces sp. NPDC048182]|uniref:Gfo/Idh/MocA family oxidoreductase n=1 Tax=unclassified Streptomyces TaxID=2593676 RepID=UPI0033BA9F9C